MKDHDQFIEYCEKSRSEFALDMSRKFNWSDKKPDEKVCIEDLLICFDQLLDRYKSTIK